MFQIEPFDGQFVVGLDAKADPSSVAPDGSISAELERLQEILKHFGARLVPLFGARQSPLRELEVEAQRLDLSRFYYLVGADGASAEMYARRLRESGELDALRDALLELRGIIEFAYFRPHPVPASAVIGDTTPDFSPLQGYLGPAPGGIDAVHARSWGPGGFGYGVHVVDVEWAWCLTHEDLALGAPVNVLSSGDQGDRNHGTAVAGMLAGDVDTKGIVGICPAAQFDAVAVANDAWAAAAAILTAAERLRAGDVLLIEMHNAGPETVMNNVDPKSQKGFIAVEYFPETLAAIRYATSRGIVVVAAAGNGDVSLDDQHATALRGGLPSNWPDAFARGENDSGSILVGAGAAPGGKLPERARLGFSNWGECVDAQGWGERVVTAGGDKDGAGDLQGGTDETRWYTAKFNGTSSAAAIVAGAVACLQGVVLAHGRPALTPVTVRELLRATGSPQQARADENFATHRIGPLPDLRRLIPAALGTPAGEARPPLPSPCAGAPAIAIYVGCGCGGGGASGGPHWGGPHWGGPHWGGPHWGGPHWGGPHWGGPHWGGPSGPG